MARKNEISGVYDLLENIPVKDNAIRGDAIFCRKELYSRIVERAGDFIFVAKGNQKALFTGIQKSFPWRLSVMTEPLRKILPSRMADLK